MSPTDRRLAALLWLITTVLVALAWHAGAPAKADASPARAQGLSSPAR